MNTAVPSFDSLAFRDIPEPDYADVTVVAVPSSLWSHLPADPAVLAAGVFDVRAAPAPVLALFWLRQRAVRLIRVPPATRDVFAVREVCGPEALLAADDRHLDFRAGVAAEHGLLRVTTAVRLHGLSGRIYFAPVRFLHPFITRAMIRAAFRQWARDSDGRTP